ncbi:MAG: transcriptional regulatory protein devR [Armatimonadetes bacterium CSP1-3]|nr:MAG: transcriptional regulatory protein devR [Armatimonadetes bacterium CSP1-3]
MSTPITVLLVDDHEVVRVGLRTLLAAQQTIKVVGEAATMREAVAEAARLTPDVVMMDVRLPDGDGIEACRAIRAARPECRVVMLTSYADDEALISSVMAGASGYLLKQTRGLEVVRAIEEAAAGRSLLDPSAAERLLRHFRDLARGREELSQLTDQERRVLELVAEGKTNREIGEALSLAEKTVKNYVSSILSKLQLRRRTDAAVYAAQRRTRLGGSVGRDPGSDPP